MLTSRILTFMTLPKMKLILCILLFADLLHAQYYVQILASPDTNMVKDSTKTLQRYALPFVVERSQKNKTDFLRLRLGPFADTLSVRQLTDFLQYKDIWIIKKNSATEHSAASIRTVYLDTFATTPLYPYYYISSKNNFCAVYTKVFGPEAVALPSGMNLYTKHRKTVITDITGFQETDSSLLFGKSVLIDTDYDGVFNNDKINNFIKNNSLIHHDVYAALGYYNDGTHIRMTLLHELSLSGGTLKNLNKTGFDYLDADFSPHVWHGTVDKVDLGNAAMSTLYQTNVKPIEAGPVKILTKIVDNDLLVVCIVFFDERGVRVEG